MTKATTSRTRYLLPITLTALSLSVLAIGASEVIAHGDEAHEPAAPAMDSAHSGHGSKQKEAPGHSHEMASKHGGHVSMTREFHTEVVFRPDSLRLYLYDGKQGPLSLRGVTGKAAARMRAGSTRQFPLQYVAAESGMDYMAGQFPFADMSPGQVKLALELNGLPGKTETSVRHMVPFSGLTRSKDAHDMSDGHHGSGMKVPEAGSMSHEAGSMSDEHGSHDH